VERKTECNIFKIFLLLKDSH